ncbi:hypothetical protein SAY87_028996 [Trapa incisa]|uniref:GDSL esterase/lipase 1-like n=1 Tax=Trapa incisa TaxID=236973 RepID=A0AAN7L3W8_9MYRT|nr:hypothetical protein SAY87_028996 [Trapa incisa]
MSASMTMSPLLSSVIIILLFLAAVSAAARPENRQAAALFVFGDSVFDAGTNNFINTTADFRANFAPYGETFFKYPTGRFGDGRLIPDFIAEFARLPLFPPYLQPGKFRLAGGVNFASGGAGALVETYQGYVVSLEAQTRQFEKLVKQLERASGVESAQKTLADAVYMISIGANDYLFPLSNNSTAFQSQSHEEYVEMVVGNTAKAIKRIHKKGGRKFGLLKMPPLGCLPLTRAMAVSNSAGGCLEEIDGIVKLHNQVALPKALKKLEKKLDGFKYSVFDFYTSTVELINNPSKYGFKEGKTACCGSGRYRGNYSCGGKRGEMEYELCNHPSEYVFFDSIHATERAYRHLAELMWSGSPPITGPYNMESLFKLA